MRPAAFAFVLILAIVAIDAPADDVPPDEQLRRLRQENAALKAELADRPSMPYFWIAVGFVGQVVFGLRFVLQWIVSEREKKSIIPVSFWYLSLLGSAILLTYAIYRVDPVFIAGFSLNMLIYVRNLYFIHRHRKEQELGAVKAMDQETAG